MCITLRTNGVLIKQLGFVKCAQLVSSIDQQCSISMLNEMRSLDLGQK